MASFQSHLNVLVMIALLASLLVHVTESMEIRQSDYEVRVKNSNGETYIAHVIEQMDLVVKLKCTCTLWTKCDSKNMVKLSK